MPNLKGKTVFLRALESDDLQSLYDLENDVTLWEVSETQLPFSKYVLQQYLDSAHKDIYEVRQLRLVISTYAMQLAGCVDLYGFDPKNRRAGVGIVVTEPFRRKGIGKEVLELVTEYARKFLGLHQLYAYISEENTASRKLFEKSGYEPKGTLSDWIFSDGKYKNVSLYQLILD
ncbi:MAG: GNAT family protein [Capnocytophaga sp.]|nr:GNAT family protein [Capnocytophaga sp.]